MIRQSTQDVESQPLKRSPRQRLEDLAADGQVAGIVELLTKRWVEGAVGAEEKTALLRQAVQVHADKGVPALIECVYGVMIAYDLQFLLRSQLQISQDLTFADRRDGGPVGDPIPVAANERIPRLMAQEDRLLELVSGYLRARKALALLAESPAHPVDDPVFPPESPEHLRFFRLAAVDESEGSRTHDQRNECAVPSSVAVR